MEFTSSFWDEISSSYLKSKIIFYILDHQKQKKENLTHPKSST